MVFYLYTLPDWSFDDMIKIMLTKKPVASNAQTLGVCKRYCMTRQIRPCTGIRIRAPTRSGRY